MIFDHIKELENQRPWENHAPMAIETMKNGAHAFVEVPMATTIEDLWEIVNISCLHLHV